MTTQGGAGLGVEVADPLRADREDLVVAHRRHLLGGDDLPELKADSPWPRQEPRSRPTLKPAHDRDRHDGCRGPLRDQGEAALELAELAVFGPRSLGKDRHRRPPLEPRDHHLHRLDRR